MLGSVEFTQRKNPHQMAMCPPSSDPWGGISFPGPFSATHLCPGHVQRRVQIWLWEEEARGLVHLRGPHARVQSGFGDGDIRGVSRFPLQAGSKERENRLLVFRCQQWIRTSLHRGRAVWMALDGVGDSWDRDWASVGLGQAKRHSQAEPLGTGLQFIRHTSQGPSHKPPAPLLKHAGV